MGFSTKITNEENKGQVANLKAAGDDTHISALKIEAPLQCGQHTHLRDKQSRINAKFCHETHSVKLLGMSWLVHVAYAANELAPLHLNGWLAFTIAVHSMLSEFLWNPLPPQLHLYRSSTGYYICYLCSSSMS